MGTEVCKRAALGQGAGLRRMSWSRETEMLILWDELVILGFGGILKDCFSVSHNYSPLASCFFPYIMQILIKPSTLLDSGTIVLSCDVYQLTL